MNKKIYSVVAIVAGLIIGPVAVISASTLNVLSTQTQTAPTVSNVVTATTVTDLNQANVLAKYPNTIVYSFESSTPTGTATCYVAVQSQSTSISCVK